MVNALERQLSFLSEIEAKVEERIRACSKAAENAPNENDKKLWLESVAFWENFLEDNKKMEGETCANFENCCMSPVEGNLKSSSIKQKFLLFFNWIYNFFKKKVDTKKKRQ